MLRTGVCWALLLGALMVGSWASRVHKRTKRQMDQDIFALGEEEDYRSPHELKAIYVSAKLMKGHDELSPDEYKRLMHHLMDLMDLDSDGFINRHELKTWLVRSHKSMNKYEVSDRFDEVDVDGDEMVTWEELYADLYGSESEEQMELEPAKTKNGAVVAEDKELFDAADGDKDGSLNLSEFTRFETPEEFPYMVAIGLKQLIPRIDTNNDGRIDFKEFTVMQVKMKEFHNARDQFDLDFDKNGDGYLTGTEIVAWLFPNIEDMSEFQVYYMFETFDKFHEGHLPYQPIIDKYGKMLVYEAIDLGLNLRLHAEDEL